MSQKIQNLPKYYRPDIDGLRAIAIISVLIFHFFPKNLPGGFIGVDIFFVISGYLITNIILKDLNKNKFSIKEFYFKRIKRIFPSLLIMLTSFIIIGWVVLLPEEFKSFGKHILGGTLFVSNFILWKEVGYFDTASEVKPLLHLWSLAIEEQFYIFWPIIIFFAWKNRKRLNLIIFCIFIFSFIWNIYIVNDQRTQVFYSPLTRFWEIIAGGILAHHHSNHIKKLPLLDHNFFSYIGLIFIGYSIFIFDNKTIFPGWIALLPVIGTILIINSKNSFLNSKILSNKFLVLIGLISFPLYLWHWPILTFARLTNVGEINFKIKILLFILSFILSYLTYKYVENPLKNINPNSKFVKHLILFLISISICISFTGLIIYKNDGFKKRPFLVNSMKLPYPASNCLEFFTDLKDAFCDKSSSKPTIAIIGDSHANRLYHGFYYHKDPKYNKIILLGAGSCYPTLGVENRPGCEEQLNSALNIIINDNLLTKVVITSYYENLKSPENDNFNKNMKAYSATIDKLIKYKKVVAIVLDTPTLDFDPKTCQGLRPFYLTTENLRGDCSIFAEDHDKARIYYYNFMRKLSSKYPMIKFYDPRDLFLKDNKYWAIKNNFILFDDYNHITAEAALMVADKMISQGF